MLLVPAMAREHTRPEPTCGVNLSYGGVAQPRNAADRIDFSGDRLAGAVGEVAEQ
jgi:hypothetical protein